MAGHMWEEGAIKRGEEVERAGEPKKSLGLEGRTRGKKRHQEQIFLNNG